MAIVRIDRGQFAQQLTVEMAAVGQLGEVQRPQQVVLQQGRQGVVGGDGDVDRLATAQRLVQFLGGGEGVVLDADAGVLLEGLEHLRVDVVVPVVDAQGLLGLGQPGCEGEEQQGGKAGHGIFSLDGTERTMVPEPGGRGIDAGQHRVWREAWRQAVPWRTFPGSEKRTGAVSQTQTPPR